MQRLSEIFSKAKDFIYRKPLIGVGIFVILVIALFTRFYNYPETLYFIYDQGRDVWKLREIIGGDITLLGPTSGLEGFFLGPLWYYLGIPGYLFSQGNPFGISLWYITLGLLVVPFFWWMNYQLHVSDAAAEENSDELWWVVIATLLMVIVPGSIVGATTIWNPLISLPLMAMSFVFFVKARHSRWYLAAAVCALAFTLQSEFAYAIFFGPVLLGIIPLIRQRFDWKDYGVAAVAGGVTLIPQLVFELKNNFLLTRRLIGGALQSDDAISYAELFQVRPLQLYESSKELVVGNFFASDVVFMILMIVAFVAIFSALGNRVVIKKSRKHLSRILLIIFTLTPYVGYMFWRGNHGNFFSYYITSHFVFLVPLLVLGVRRIFSLLYERSSSIVAYLFAITVLVSMSVGGLIHVWNIQIEPNNQAGITVMLEAVDQVYAWHEDLNVDDEAVAIRIFTPYRYTEHYDYLFQWRAEESDQEILPTQRDGDEEYWYVLLESPDPDNVIYEEWYEQVAAGGELQSTREVGVLRLELWEADEN